MDSSRRWVILGVAVLAQAAVSALVYGPPYLIPNLQAEAGLSLPEASTVSVVPVLGLLCALIAWGAAADRFGERLVMTVGMAGSGLAGALATTVPGTVAMSAALAVAGVFAAAISAASGRAVLGWFRVDQRGLAMGIRQTCTPLGMAFAAVTLPPAALAWGYRGAMLVPALVCLAVAVPVGLLLRDPPRPAAKTAAATRSPYRTARLWRIHAASALLVGPQFVSGIFALTYLVTVLGWSAVAAGTLVGAVQFAGAAARIGAGVWSDRAGSRMRPMRTIAVLAGLSLVVWAVGALTAPWLAVAGLVATLVVSVMDNGLAFTATAELAGPHWAGRALGVQNTGQNLTSLLVAPAFAALVTAVDWPLAIALAVLFPLAAVLITPVRGETLEPVNQEAPAKPAG